MDLATAVSELKDELGSKPSLLQDEREVIQKFGSLFRYDNIDDISIEEFQSFLDIKYNRHWTLHRLKTAITRDMPKLKAALKILLNESISLEQRLRRIRDRHSPDYKENMGRAIFSPILLVTNPSKYPVYNGTVERAFEKLGIPKLKKIKVLPCIVPKQKAIDLYAETAGINKFFESAMKFNSFWKNGMFATPKSVLFSLAFTVSINAETCL